MDLIVRLLGESASYAQAMARGAAETTKIDQQLERLTVTMQRQQVASQLSTREAQVLALADKGASTAAAEYAISVARELDSLDALAVAEAEAARARRQATQAAAENAAWVQQTIQTSREAARINQESSIYLKLKEAATRGATEAELNAIQAAFQLEQRNRQVSESLKQRTAAQERLNSTTNSGTGASKTNLFAIQALAFGIQDATQVYGNMGLAGAISASANNLIFMGSLLSPHLGIVIAVTVATGQLVQAMWPLITGLKNQKLATAELIKEQERQLELQTQINDRTRDFNRALEGARDFQSTKTVANDKEATIKSLQEEEAQILKSIELQRKQRDERQAIRNEERRMASWGGARAMDMGLVNETVTLKEIEGFNARIVEQQNKILEINVKRRQLEEQEKTARSQQSAQDVSRREFDSAKYARDQREKALDDEFKMIKQREAEQEADRQNRMKERAKALTEVAGFTVKTSTEKLGKADAARKKLSDTLKQRLAAIEEWKKAKVLSYQEAAAAKAEAADAYMSQRQKLEERISADKKKKADAARAELEKKSKPTRADLKATSANSMEAFKAVFEATNGGAGPQEALVDATRDGNKLTGQLVRLFQGFVEETGKRGIVKVK